MTKSKIESLIEKRCKAWIKDAPKYKGEDPSDYIVNLTI